MNHFILHMDLDSFFVSVERLKNPSLNGKPVIIGGSSKRGVVSSCSYEARKMGVHSAMPGFKAQQLCPNGIFISSDFANYSKYSKLVTDVIASRVPIFEKASIDEFYIDLTGMDKYFGCFDFAKTLREEIIETTGLPISFGLGANKVIAKMATNHAKPNGYKFIQHGEEFAFLDPLRIDEIPGLGKQSVQFLQDRNIFTIAELRNIGKLQLEQWMGKHGESLWKRANGLGSVTIRAERERKSISKEHTFLEDTNDAEFLLAVLHQMAEQLAHRLRIEGKKATNLSIKLKTPQFVSTTKQITIPATNYEHQIIPIITRFFTQLYNQQKLRLIGLRLGSFTAQATQNNLFEDVEKQNQLYDSIDELKLKFGKTSLQRGTSKSTTSFSKRRKD